MFCINSHVWRIYLPDFDAASGGTGEPSVLLDQVNVDKAYRGFGFPGGMTNDAEGKVWIVCYDEGTSRFAFLVTLITDVMYIFN